MTPPTLEHLLQQVLDGGLSASEQAQGEHQLQSDPHLGPQLRAHQALRAGLSNLAGAQPGLGFSARVQARLARTPVAAEKPWRTWWRAWSWPALLGCAAAAAGMVLWFHGEKETHPNGVASAGMVATSHTPISVTLRLRAGPGDWVPIAALFKAAGMDVGACPAAMAVPSVTVNASAGAVAAAAQELSSHFVVDLVGLPAALDEPVALRLVLMSP